jgi:hypothetical protein
MASHVSGASLVPLVFQAVEISVDRAPYAQQMNDHSSGGRSVRAVGSIQSPHAVLPSWPRSNCRSRVTQPFWFIEERSTQRRLIRWGQWNSPLMQQQNCRNEDQDEEGRDQKDHPSPRLITPW